MKCDLYFYKYLIYGFISDFPSMKTSGSRSRIRTAPRYLTKFEIVSSACQFGINSKSLTKNRIEKISWHSPFKSLLRQCPTHTAVYIPGCFMSWIPLRLFAKLSWIHSSCGYIVPVKDGEAEEYVDPGENGVIWNVGDGVEPGPPRGEGNGQLASDSGGGYMFSRCWKARGTGSAQH